MEFLTALWLPILLSAVLVFIASSLFHMVIPIHKNDAKKLPGEDRILEAIRGQSLPPESYRFPYASSMKDFESPEMMEKWKQGPVGFMTIVKSGPPAMGASLIQWFLYCLVIGVFVAYVARLGLPDGAAYLRVFQMTGAVAVVGYAFNHVTDSIWKGVKWEVTWRFLFDGVVYALLTAGTFSWLWPSGL